MLQTGSNHQENGEVKIVFRIRIRIDFGRLDPDQGEQKRPTSVEKKLRNFMFKVLDVLF
jgi:hypothetical protein